MFRFTERRSNNIDWKQCYNKGKCLTTKNGWLNPERHEFNILPDGTVVCKKCQNKGRQEEEQRQWKPPEPQCEISIKHEDEGFLIGIRRTRARTDKQYGSDRWVCNRCGKIGDFWFFEYYPCQKLLQEDTTKHDGRKQILPEIDGQTTFERG